MTNLDTDIDPRKPENIDSIIQWAQAGGDMSEIQALELKSTLSFEPKSAQKSSFAKMVKFIFGVANRDEHRAARDFMGYGIMLIGVEEGKVQGVEIVPEEHDFRAATKVYFGPTVPRFTLRSHIFDGKNVLVLLVDPPVNGQPIYICEKDGPETTEGTVYYRESTATQKANSYQLRELFERYKGGKASVTFQADGSLTKVDINKEDENTYWSQKSRELLARINGERSVERSQGILNTTQCYNSRPSDEEQIRAAQTWPNRWKDTFQKTLELTGPEVTFELTNDGSITLRNLKVEIVFPHEVKVLRSRNNYDLKPYETKPILPVPRLPSSTDLDFITGKSEIDVGEEIGESNDRIFWSPDVLTPGDKAKTSLEKLVIVTRHDTEQVAVGWTITAEGLSTPCRGELELPVFRIAGRQQLEDALESKKHLA